MHFAARIIKFLEITKFLIWLKFHANIFIDHNLIILLNDSLTFYIGVLYVRHDSLLTNFSPCWNKIVMHIKLDFI